MCNSETKVKTCLAIFGAFILSQLPMIPVVVWREKIGSDQSNNILIMISAVGILFFVIGLCGVLCCNCCLHGRESRAIAPHQQQQNRPLNRPLLNNNHQPPLPHLAVRRDSGASEGSSLVSISVSEDSGFVDTIRSSMV